MRARHYERCVICGTTERKPLTRGFCTRCYWQYYGFGQKVDNKRKAPLKMLTKDFLEEEYLKKKLTISEIAKNVGCHPNSVRQKLILYGIPRRSNQEYGNLDEKPEVITPQKTDASALLQKASRIGSLIEDNPENINIDVYLAHIAGLFDAEVTIRPGKGSIYISYSKSSLLILDYLKNIFDGYTKCYPKQPYDRYPRCQWHLSSTLAYRALKKLYPFLRRKKGLALVCIERYESYHNPNIKRAITKQN